MMAWLFQRCDRSLRLASQAIMVAHQGIWLGLLRARHLDQITNAYYDRASKYVDPAYNGSGLRDWESQMLAQYFEPGSQILVAAAGGGREIIALARAGYSVDGFDCNEVCVRKGRLILKDLGLACRLLLAAPSGLPAGLTTYDGVIIGWGGYMHIVGRARRISLLERLARHMHDEAPMLVSFFQQDRRSGSQLWAARIANVLRAAMGAERVEPGDWLDGSFDHHFTEAEFRAELAAAGFRVERYLTPGYGVAIVRVDRRGSSNRSTLQKAAAQIASNTGRKVPVSAAQEALHG